VSAATFLPDKPCKHGHLSPRRVKGNACVECNDAAVRRYRAAHPERPRAYARKYAKAFPEKVRAAQAAWYAKAPAKATETKRAWTRANPERHAATSMRRHARKMKAPGRGVTAEQRQEILDVALGLCAYCNERKKLNLDHIEPLARGGAHDVENVVPACKSCNSSKGDTPLLLWLAYRFR
jgi:5-methylcytosine-specific restriction endonuclease McrA